MPSKKPSLKIQISLLATVYLLFPYIVFAFKLFPNGDSYNAYVSIYHYLISSLLNGVLPYWDPLAACGSPFYLLFMTAGVFEPFFAVSVLLGKISSLNVLQVYYLWIFLRTLPLLLGMFWLLKQLSRNMWLALFCSAFFYYTISFCLLRDGIPYVLYWPLMLACLVHFMKSLSQKSPSIKSFIAFVVCFGVSLLLHNPSYTLVFLGCLIVSVILLSPRKCASLWVLFLKKTHITALVAGLCILFVLLSPAMVLWQHYSHGDYFAYVRVHQAQRNVGRSLSNFDNEKLDYVEVSLEASPMRQGKELSTVFFPFLYGMNWVADGTLYFGFISLLGIVFGIIHRRSKVFAIYLVASLLVIFYMTWSANGLIRLLRPVLPFLKILNQRQLLYSAFLLLASVAGCLGLRSIIEKSERKKLLLKLSWKKALSIGALLAGGFSVFTILMTTTSLELKTVFNMKILRMVILFILLWTVVIFAAKKSMKSSSKWNRYFLVILAVIFIVDLGFYLNFLSQIYLPDKNKNVTAKSQFIRKKLNLEYRPFRTPLLPVVFGGTLTNSVVHQTNVRTALPAYWHSDITFSTKRYYDLINSLNMIRVKYLLSVDSPIIKLYPNAMQLKDDEDAVIHLSSTQFKTLGNTVLLQSPEKSHKKLKNLIQKRSFLNSPLIRRVIPPIGPLQEGFRGTYYAALYDYSITFPWGSFEEISQGMYHKQLYRLKFTEKSKLIFKNKEDLLERFYFPEFPLATDVDGMLYFVDRDREAMLRIVSNEGILVETDRGEALLPNVIYGRHYRPHESDNTEVEYYSPNRVIIKTNNSQASTLVYTDLYDSHWKAYLDGEKTSLLLANHAFKAVKVPSGEHRIVFEYHVPYLGLSIMLYYLFLTLSGLFILRGESFIFLTRFLKQ